MKPCTLVALALLTLPVVAFAGPAPSLAQAAGGHGTGYVQPDAPLLVENAWARASAGPVKTGAAFLTVTNRGSEPDRLVGGTSPVAGTIEVHTHIKDGDVMRMRRVDDVEVRPGDTVTLAPGGLHLMLMGLTAPLHEGTTFPLTLSFEKAGLVEVTVQVMEVGAMGAGGHKH